MSRTVRPGEAGRSELPAERAKNAEVEAFLQAAARVTAHRDAKPARAAQPKGRLIFALDATASRQPTWDQACDIQGEMFAATASLGGVGLTCAAMTPCMRLYAYLGQQLAAGPVDERYAQWVRTYADPGFESLAATLERLLDTYADGDGPAAYRRAMQLEVAFFDAVYEQ